jgi:hypothetical protein
MSIDFYFWRQREPLPVRPGEFFEQLSATAGSPFVIPMTREEVFAAFRREFPSLQDTGDGIDWEGDGNYFQVCFTYDEQKRLTSVQLGCDLSFCRTPSFKRLFEVAYELGCRVYDPQQSKVLIPVSAAKGSGATNLPPNQQRWMIGKA